MCSELARELAAVSCKLSSTKDVKLYTSIVVVLCMLQTTRLESASMLSALLNIR